MDKVKVHKQALEIQRTKVDELKNLSQKIHNDSGLDHEDVVDTDDLSRFSEITDNYLEIKSHLNAAKSDLAFLENLEIHPRDAVSLGALVQTDLLCFYIGITLPAFECEGKKVVGISTDAPIFGQMIGKKKGDTFEFHGRKYHIEAVY